MRPWIDRCDPYVLTLKDKFIPLLEEGDVGMVELFDLRCEGLEVLGLHVKDENGDIEAIDLLELFFKHGGGLTWFRKGRILFFLNRRNITYPLS